MDDQQKQLIDKLRTAQNVLVTVSKNPSVDQLAAAIGLTLALNKMDKHAAAVYSGQTPSALEFLKPEDTIEKTTDSLRDFIIALDKSKADKLRYKVEDQLVRIFITPYRSSITEEDLDFSQGDFNVDVVVALGVHSQQDLDEAIQAHGRILHDALVSSIALDGQPELGTLNIVRPKASSLSEVITQLVLELDKDIVDGQIATALLTGIVATTERFRNDRTTPETMNVSASLMAAGANQQLVANELEAPEAPEEVPAPPLNPPEEPSAPDAEPKAPPQEPGVLEVQHDDDKPSSAKKLETEKTDQLTADEAEAARAPQIEVDSEGRLMTPGDTSEKMLPKIGDVHGDPGEGRDDLGRQPLIARERVVDPPSRGGSLTANTEEEALGGAVESLTMPAADVPLLSHDTAPAEASAPVVDSAPEASLPPADPVGSVLPPSPPAYVPMPSDASFLPTDTGTPPDTAQTALSPEPVVPSLPVPPAPEPPLAPPPQPVGADNDTSIDTERQTLSDIEKVVDSPHALAHDSEAVNTSAAPADIESARDAVSAALVGGPAPAPNPIAALNAQPLGDSLHNLVAPSTAVNDPVASSPAQTPAVSDAPLPPLPLPPPVPPASTFPGVAPASTTANTTPPPPVPPPPIFSQ